MQGDKRELTAQDKTAMESIGRAVGRAVFGAKDIAEVAERVREFNESIASSGFVVLIPSEP